jgi:hypothetical protein
MMYALNARRLQQLALREGRGVATPALAVQLGLEDGHCFSRADLEGADLRSLIEAAQYALEAQLTPGGDELSPNGQTPPDPKTAARLLDKVRAHRARLPASDPADLDIEDPNAPPSHCEGGLDPYIERALRRIFAARVQKDQAPPGL